MITLLHGLVALLLFVAAKALPLGLGSRHDTAGLFKILGLGATPDGARLYINRPAYSGNPRQLDLSITDEPLLSRETGQTIQQAHRKEKRRGEGAAGRHKLERRQETPDYEHLRNIHRKDALAYVKEYAGPYNKAKRERLQRNEGSPQELEKFRRLSRARNNYQNANYHLRNPPASNSKPKVPDLTPEQGEALREYSNAYDREFKKRYRPEELAEFQAGRGDPELVERFHQLFEPARIFRTWDARMLRRRPRATADSKIFTPEQLNKLAALHKILDANREGYSRYSKKFGRGKIAKDLATRRRARQGTPAELEEFDTLLEASKTYHNTAQKIKRLGQVIDIEFDKTLREDIEELEELRPDFKAYRKEFGGKDNAERRAELDAGQGPTDVVERYNRLKPRYTAYNRIYKKALTKTKQGWVDEDDGGNDEPTIIQGTGRKRYFRPTYKARQNQKKGEKDDVPNSEENNESRFEIIDTPISGIDVRRIPVDGQSEHTKSSISCGQTGGSVQMQCVKTTTKGIVTPGLGDYWNAVTSRSSRMWKEFKDRGSDIQNRFGEAISGTTGSAKPLRGAVPMMPFQGLVLAP
ncbi:MAG: hypothetical protein M1816_003499 [Peltula sp. TS41687]|nr:MAG: hypothetical protein M1816_003499 [Peltula sp. TS41687]